MNTNMSKLKQGMMNILSYQRNSQREESVSSHSTVGRLRQALLALLLLTTGAGSAWADTWDGSTKTAPDMSTNKGTSEAFAIQISSAAELAWLGDQMRQGNTATGKTYGNKYWILTADIDLGGNSTFTGKDWASMIGHTGNAFCGYFDGNNKTISNIQVAAVTSTKYYGLFTSIQGKSTTDLSTVHDLNISGVFIKATVSCAASTRIGGLAGYVKQANITNVNVSGVTFTFTNTITNTTQLGGAIGCMENNTTLNNVDVTGVTASFGNTTTKLYLGGVVGQSGGTQNTNSITNCDVKSIKITHSSNITGETQFGGLVGQANTSLCTISNNTVEGQGGVNGGKGFDVSITGTTASLSVGGLLGYATGNASSTISVSGCHAYDFHISHTGAVSSANIGGLIGSMSNYVTVTSSNAKSVNATFNNTTTSLYLGGLVGQSSGGTANTNSITGNTVNTVKVTHNNNITGTTYMGGLVGNAQANLNVINNNTVSGQESVNDGKGFDVSVSGTTVNFYAGGLLGYTKGDGHEVKGNRVEKIYITNTSTINGGRLGGFIGYVESDNTTSKILVKGNTASTVNIQVDGNTVGTPYLGGFIGQAKGKASPDNRTVIEGNTVTSPTVVMNGEVGHGFYMGGFIGYADTHTNLYNNKVATPAITIANDINAETYVGGAVGRQAGYTTIDGMTVSGGSINGPSANKSVKNNTVFFVGGFIGQQNSSGTAAYQPNKFMNIAVSGININLGKYEPAAQIQNHKFAVGGIAGSVNTPNKDVNGFCGMPENLVSTGVKIYAPYAATSPTVALFGTGAPAHNNLTADVAATVFDGLDRSKSGTWLYSNYKLGLSPEFLASGNVISNDAEPALDKYRKNYTATPAEDGGISYLSVTDETFKKNNRYLDTERDSKTVLWWTNSQGYAAAGPTTTNFTTYEQPIYPNGATAAQVAQLTSLPYYMYFFQGVSNAKYTNKADAEKIVAGIEANVAESAKTEPLTLTITNANEGQRGFDNQTFSVEASSSVDSYQWYVDGKAAGTTTAQTAAPDWKFGKSIVVNAIKGGNIVASASYAMPVGVLKTKNSSEKIRSDINGRGTKANPYVIDGEAALRQWSYLSTYSNSLFFETMDKLHTDGKSAYHPMYHYNRAYYVLEANIDLGGKEFTPISHMGFSDNGTDGTYSQNYIFQGNFEGNGNTISNFEITWRAGQRNGNDINSYHGFFGAVGGPTAVAKWGDTGTSNTVVQNLVIDKATLKHDVKNTTFAYKSHNHIVSTNTNNCEVGVLAGVVAANTTVQNIEIRGSKITDYGSSDYSLATRGLFVGGAIGSVQGAFNSTNIPTNTVIKNIVVGTDIDLTHAMIQDLAFAQQGAYNVGGIIGRFASTNGNLSATQAVMPKYLLYTGSIKACYTAASGKKDALISPVIAATRYSSNQSISDKNISKIWEGNNNGTEQLTVADALYYNFKISDASGTMHLVTEDYPNKVCSQGARAQDTHTDGNETAAGYLGQRYQGVNYNAIFCDAATYDEDADGGKRMAIAILNSHNDVDIYWEWTPGHATPHMTNTPTAGAYIVRDAETADKYNVVGTAATADKYYKWYVGGVELTGDDKHSSSITVPADISETNIKAEVYENSSAVSPIASTQYLVIKGEFKVNTSIKKEGDTYTVGLTRGGVDLTTNTLDGRIAVTYQWYKGNAVNVNTAEQLSCTTKSITIDKATLGEVNNLFCHVTISTTGDPAEELFKGDISQYVREANVVYLQLNDVKASNGTTYNASDAGTNTGNNDTYGVKQVDYAGATYGKTPETPVKSWAEAYALLKPYTEPTSANVQDGKYKTSAGTLTDYTVTWTSEKVYDFSNVPLDEYEFDVYKRDNFKRKVKPIEQCTNNWNNNVIVLMGLSKDGYFNNSETTMHNIDGKIANKPVTITGQWDGTNYYGYLSNLSGDFSINADHKFENMGIGVLDKGIGATESIRYRIYAHRWNVHAGKGLLMGWAAALEWGPTVVPVNDDNKKIYKITSADVSTGTPVGKYACDIAIMGGYLNDNTSTNPEMFEYINHGRDDIGQQIKIESGFWGPVCPGNRQTDSGNTITTYYTMGGPDHPAKTNITVDIDRAWNDGNGGKRAQFNSAMSPATVDVGCLLTGNHEGTMYADVTLDILSGNMGRIVNGIKGAQRRQIKNPDSFKTNDVYRHTVNYGTKETPSWTAIAAPAPDSYFGRGILNFDPSSSENNAGAGNAGVNVVELYCGGLGRGHNDGSYHPEVRSYFYGLCEVNIKGGTFQKTIYGSGAGGTNGIGTATNHTDDDGLPYWDTTNETADANGKTPHVWYAPYEYIKGNGHNYNFVKVKVTGTGSDDVNLEDGYINLEKTRNIINITGGIFGSEEKPVSIYAGGNGETDAALINPSGTKVGDVKNTYNTPNHQAGNMYGAADGLTTEINISGDAKIYGSIFGGGRGTMRYYRFFLRAPDATIAYPNDNQEYTRIWNPKTSSNGDYNTNGGADWTNIINSRKNADRYLNLGQVYGNTKVSISGNVEILGNVYGGGEGVSDITLNELIKTADSEFGLGSSQTKSDVAALKGSLADDKRSTHVDLTAADDSYVNFPNMGKIFGNAGVEISGNVTIHGNVYGGGKAGAIQGTTTVDVKGSVNIFGEVYGAGQGLLVDKSKNYKEVATIIGDATVNLSENATIWQDMFGGGENAVVNGDTHFNMLGGHVAANVYGGGKGDIKKDGDGNYTYVDNALVITSADIFGNTNVDIRGGDIVWNRTSMESAVASSKTTYTYSKTTYGESSNDTYTTEDADVTKDMVQSLYEEDGYTIEVADRTGPDSEGKYSFVVTLKPTTVESEEVESTNTTRISELETAGYKKTAEKTEDTGLAKGEIVYWNPADQSLADNTIVEGRKYYNSLFYDTDKKQFKIKHNIFGGGYVACRVGTYSDAGVLQTKKDKENNDVITGTANVYVYRGLFGQDLLKTQQWKDCYDDNQDPHFYIFGGGYGAYTSVGNTIVGIGVDDVIEDNPFYSDEQWAKPMAGGLSTPVNPDDDDQSIFSEKYGQPEHTVLGVLGGGYAGIVTHNTDVQVGGNTFLHRIYGGGYGQLSAYNELKSTDKIYKVGTSGAEYDREDLGMVMGHTHVLTTGAFIHGDVFGGGAGVESIDTNSDGTINQNFTMGAVKGYTRVDIDGESKVYGSVYGGGDVACVDGVSSETVFSLTATPKPEVLNEDGTTAENPVYATTNVTVKAGEVFGNVFAGGKGRSSAEVAQTSDEATAKVIAIGKVTGNTFVNIINQVDEGDNVIKPAIYGDIYGGAEFGQVVKSSENGGNTYVTINGGNIAGNIFGGGYGAVDGSTSANIEGATNVTINGGSYLWNTVADKQGNMSVLNDFDKNGNVNTYSIEAMRTNPVPFIAMAKDIFYTPKKELLFYNSKTSDKDKNEIKYSDHNIYGGGNNACNVAGQANVTVNHGMLDDDLGYADSEKWSLAAFLRYLILDNKEHPQFAVLGGGYGPHTTVASTDVKIQIDKDGIAGYDNTEDKAKWDAFYEGLKDEFEKLDATTVAELYGGSVGSNTFARYLSSRMCWTFGVPNHTVLTVAGGGMAGYVTGNTNVTLSNHSGALQVFGGGIGIQPTTGLTKQTVADEYTYGQVGGNTTVKINGGVISRGVYGGGAGIAPVKVDRDGKVLADQKADGTYRDFTNIARVLGKTDVTIDGYTTGTLVYGAVYGGGDVANVGIETVDTSDPSNPRGPREASTPSSGAYDSSYNPQANVTIQGGVVYGEVFGGGYGRTIDVCSVVGGDDTVDNDDHGYKNLGAVYGNTRVTLKTSKYTEEEAALENAAHEGMSDWTEVSTSSDKNPWTWARIYGGGSYGKVYGNTDVQIAGGNIGYNIFGAGVGFVGSKKGTDDEGGEIDVPVLTSADVTGNANVNITGGEYCISQMWYSETRSWGKAHIFEGNTYSSQYDPEQKKFLINHNIYAGSRNCGKVLGSTYLTMTKGLVKDGTPLGHAYEGTEPDNTLFAQAEWKEIYEKIGSPHFSVFGAGYGENTTVKGDTHVNINFTGTEINGEEIDAAVKASTDENEQTYKLFKSNQSVMDVIGGGYSGQVLGKTNVDIDGETFIRRAFGGSFYAPVGQTNITVHQVSADDIFGGGMMGDVTVGTVTYYDSEGNIGKPEHVSETETEYFTTSRPTSLTSGFGNVNLRIGTPGSAKNDKIFINNNVYGGNDVSGEVTGQITASILGGKIYNNVYGAGNGNYLYALNRDVEKVTTHEYYEANGQTYDLVYEVPARPGMDLPRSPGDAQKIVNINTYRPMAETVVLNIAGTQAKPLTIGGNVFGGGNTATVSTLGNRPSVTMNIGSYCNIGGVYMGADGEAMFQEKNGFMGAFQNINGVDLTNAIDWLGNIANKSISEMFLPVASANRPKIYPHVLDLYFQPIEMSVQPTLKWVGSIAADGTITGDAASLTKTTIGTFVCGGNRGNMNVEPYKNEATHGVMANYGGNVTAAGQIVNYSFPSGLTIQNRIVGGCNNANYTLGKVTHEGGYLLGGRKHDGTEINLLVECQFAPQASTDQIAAAKGNSDRIAELSSGNVFGGCYKSGTINGDVSIDVRSDMLKNVLAEVFKASKDNNVPIASVYGAGYGMESYVIGNTNVYFGKGTKATTSSQEAKSSLAANKENSSNSQLAKGSKKLLTEPVVNYGTTAKDIYGGGQQGNVIGNTTIKILNGHVAGSVVGGSYAGYMWGSTQVLVGYPKYYTVNTSGTYSLKRADKWNDAHKNFGETTPAVKPTIKLIKGDIIAEEVYDAIYAQDASQTSASQFTAHTMKPSVDSGSGIKWDDINIKIDDAAYGGGYSLASGSSVGSQTYTVLKYSDEHNLDADMKSDDLTPMGGTSRLYGGNTTVLVWDHAKASYDDDADGSTQDKEHITISTQEMTPVDLPNGTDLRGYYYKKEGEYKYVAHEGQFFKGASDSGNIYQFAYKYDGDGGVYGDGHLSFAEGFRAGEVNGYGFAQSYPGSAKILNTFQRMDMLRVSDCALVLLGACDYTVNEVSTTPYSIARVGELQMRSQNVEPEEGTTLQNAKAKNAFRSRNFIGLSNNIHYVGAVTSDVEFTDGFHDNRGAEEAEKTYRQKKQDYIDGFYKEGTNQGQKGIFQKRNDGTAKNMIGIASGYAMKILNTKTVDAKGTEDTFYGPIVGVVEIDLTNTNADEAGAYVYAANIHHRKSTGTDVPLTHEATEDFLETTGNFVFPYNADENRYVIDDCYKTEYDVQTDKTEGEPNHTKNDVEAHYWFVAGWEYYYNAHITGYTYNDPNTFYAENDGVMTLVGTIKNTEVQVESIKWRSNHANAAQDELETRNTNATSVDADKSLDASGKNVYGAYKLYIGTSNEKKFAADKLGALVGTVVDDVKTPASLSFITNTTPATMAGGTKGVEDNILIALQDDADNHGKDYFDAHFAEPCEATIVLSAPAKYIDGEGNEQIKYKYVADSDGTYYYDEVAAEFKPIAGSGVKMDGKTKYSQTEGRYKYTIYLTIDYIMGPTYSGNIQVENCALPGEMIKVSLGTLDIQSDPSMPTFGYNWKFGPRTYDEVSHKWTMSTNPEEVYTYKVGTPFNPEADSNETSEMLAGVKYNKDGNYIEVPAYYFMNGYGVEYNFNVTGINEEGNPKNFAVAMRDQDMLTIHNYHRMKPRNADGVNRASVDFHLDLAAERAASDANFAEPRIYIADAADLNELPRFLGEKAKTYYTRDEYNSANSISLTEDAFAALPSTKKEKGEGEIGSKYDFGNHMQFHLLNDIVVNNVGNANLQGDHYGDLAKPADFDAIDFKGTLNGNGYVISDLGVKKGEFTAPTYLFPANQGNIYNLGLKQGVITKGDTGADNSLYHTSYTWSNKTVYRMDGTAVKTYTDNDWRYGKVTYDLNQYYLEARKAVLDDDDETIPEESASGYVKNLFHNGDYLYARWKTASSEYLRTADASQYDANYNSLTTYHYYTLKDGVLTHPVDESRAVGYNAETKAYTCYAPLFEEAKKSETATSTTVKNDYVFFGQQLNAGTKTAALGGINTTIPEHIDAAVTRNVALMNNRVYRAGGYYKSRVSGEPYSTHGGAFFYNRAAYAHDNGITAIDFYGYQEPEGLDYEKVVDYPTARLASMGRADGVTRNLLVYANNEDDVNTGALKPYVYDEKTSEGDIKMHVIKPLTSPRPTTAYFHLVERTAADKDAEGNDCLNNDFDAPIAFDVTKRAWYTRQPAYYAERNNDAWEGITLPFTANKVEASLNGEITHFYGAAVDGSGNAPSHTDYNPATNSHTLHHEYWLRGLTGVDDKDASKTTATFQRPGEDLFTQGTAKIASYAFDNNWFVTTYGEKNYNTNEPQNVWYTTSHTYADYKPLTANVPYIVSFPGNRFYEFDLSSKFYNDVTGNGADPQTVTFDNTVDSDPITIAATSKMETKDSSLKYAHVGTFLALTDERYAMNNEGTEFVTNSGATTVLPFRTYMELIHSILIGPGSGSQHYAKPNTILIGSHGDEMMDDQKGVEEVDPSDGNRNPKMIIYPRGRRVIVESPESTTLNMYTIGGQLIRVLDVREGTNSYSGFGPGIYIVGQKRLMLK